MTVTEDAIEILRATRDGDDLAPEHLKLVESAVNGFLNELGTKAFVDLLASVRGGYRKPWLHGIEHLTRDLQGYVYWKGQRIEHWSGDVPYSERGRQAAVELQRRCMILEATGEPINTGSVIWRWEDKQ